MIEIDPAAPLYSIGVVEDIVGIPQRILRLYEEKKVIKPSRSDSNRRLYSMRDIEKIKYIHFLTHIKKVNLAGVREIFNLLDKLKDSERAALIAGLEQEIKSLSDEKKKILTEGAESVRQTLLEEGKAMGSEPTGKTG